MIRKGDIVRFKPEWQDQGDDKVVFVAVEDQCERVNGTQTVAVMALLALPINPVQVVAVDMIEPKEGTES